MSVENAHDDGKRVTAEDPICGTCGGNGKIAGGRDCGTCDGKGRTGAKVLNDPSVGSDRSTSGEFSRPYVGRTVPLSAAENDDEIRRASASDDFYRNRPPSTQNLSQADLSRELRSAGSLEMFYRRHPQVV